VILAQVVFYAFLLEVSMTNITQTPGTTPAPAGMRGEIMQKWSKFTSAEVAALKDKAELVTQVQSKYSLDKTIAQRDVDAFAKGRQL
jgi:hypothetical protein